MSILTYYQYIRYIVLVHRDSPSVLVAPPPSTMILRLVEAHLSDSRNMYNYPLGVDQAKSYGASGGERSRPTNGLSLAQQTTRSGRRAVASMVVASNHII